MSQFNVEFTIQQFVCYPWLKESKANWKDIQQYRSLRTEKEAIEYLNKLKNDTKNDTKQKKYRIVRRENGRQDILHT